MQLFCARRAYRLEYCCAFGGVIDPIKDETGYFGIRENKPDLRANRYWWDIDQDQIEEVPSGLNLLA